MSRNGLPPVAWWQAATKAGSAPGARASTSRRGGRLAQRGQAQDPRRRLGGELGEQRPVDGALARAVGGDDRDRQVLEPRAPR